MDAAYKHWMCQFVLSVKRVILLCATCSEANVVPTVNLSLALHMPLFSPSLQHPLASTHVRFLASCSILKSSWLRSFLEYKKKKKETPWTTKTLWSVHMYCVFWSYKRYCTCEQKTDVCLEQAWNKATCPSCLKWQELFLSNCKWLFIRERAGPRHCNFFHSKKIKVWHSRTLGSLVRLTSWALY